MSPVQSVTYVAGLYRHCSGRSPIRCHLSFRASHAVILPREGAAPLSSRSVGRTLSGQDGTIDAYSEMATQNLSDRIITKPADSVEALVAIFDLGAFTQFSSQPDAHLVVPAFVAEFLDWLFKEIREVARYRWQENSVLLSARLPFYAKFLGDGVLFIWDVKQASSAELSELVCELLAVCKRYQPPGYFSYAPETLRCGVARGNIVALRGEDSTDFRRSLYQCSVAAPEA